MQVGVGWWLMFEDRWAAVLRFLPRFSFFCIAVFCVAVCIAMFALQVFCAAALFGC